MRMSYPVIAPKFRGPPDSGNGGYSAGLLAATIEGAAEITLHAPPPLDRTLDLASDGAIATLRLGKTVIASARAAPLTHPALADTEAVLSRVPDYATALDHQPSYAGFTRHNFPGCFVCGPDRATRDGLRIFGAPFANGVVAAWCPRADLAADDGLIDEIYLHAALDCPSYFAFGDTRLVALLGRMHCEIHARPRIDEPCVIYAWPVAEDGRKRHSAAVCVGGSGQLLARTVNTWIQIDGEIPKPPI